MSFEITIRCNGCEKREAAVVSEEISLAAAIKNGFRQVLIDTTKYHFCADCTKLIKEQL